jgi:hypothetical protein
VTRIPVEFLTSVPLVINEISSAFTDQDAFNSDSTSETENMFTHLVEFLGREIGPPPGVSVDTGEHNHRKKSNFHTSHEWDSNR